MRGAGGQDHSPGDAGNGCQALGAGAWRIVAAVIKWDRKSITLTPTLTLTLTLTITITLTLTSDKVGQEVNAVPGIGGPGWG